jgi:predicted amidohydrolase YtcJ
MDSEQTTPDGGEAPEGQTPEAPAPEAQPRSLSRKKFLAASAGVVGGALGLSAAGQAITPPTAPTPPKVTPPTAPTPPVITPPTPPNLGRPIGSTDKDIVLVNGKIHTMDGSNRVVSQVRISKGRFVEVGNNVDRSNAEIVNLVNRTVIPGLIEGHIHVVSLANRPGYHEPGVENARNIAEIQAVLAARRKEVPEGQWITSMGGWHPNLFAERRLPTLAELDAAVSDRPVFLYQQGGGPAVTNSLGKAFFESQGDALAGPVVVSATGAIANTPAPNMANRALYFLRKLQTMADKERGAVDAMRYSARVGLTAHLDQTLPPSNGPIVPTQGLPNLDQFRMYDGWLAANRNGKSLVRLQINFLHNETDINLPELKARLRNQFQLFGNDMMMTGGIGEWGAAGDGVGATWLEAQKVIAAAGWRNTNRNLSLASLQAELTGYETIAGMGYDISGTGLRWTLHHLNVATPAELARCKALGIGVQAGAWRFVTGTGTAAGAPFRMIVDSGVQAGIHQDGVHIACMNPWFAIYYATTGLNALGQQINVGQSITRQEAIRLFTRENAWHLSMEDDLGSIEAGKLADLLVLSSDYTTVSDEELKRILPVLTLVGGKVVYDAGVV